MNINIKNYCLDALRFIHNLSTADFKKYLLISTISFAVVISASLYFIYSSCNSLTKEINRLQNAKKKTRSLLTNYAAIAAEEARIKTMLEQHKNFDLKIYFEQFCKTQGLTAAPGWNAASSPINPQVDEIELTASFKEITTEMVVQMLQEFDKTELVYLKNIRIKADKNKKITCEVTLATIQNKAQA